MKLLLYCTKGKPYLVYGDEYIGGSFVEQYCLTSGYSKEDVDKIWGSLNGKIVAECDFEVEEIKRINTVGDWFCYENQDEILEKSCMTDINRFFEYLKGKNGYAIHIKNLHIFEEPRELSDYYIKHCPYGKCSTCEYGKEEIHCVTIDTPITKAPQNMMYCYEEDEMKVLISIRPEWLCKILNGEKTMECRKRILKEML